MARLSRKRFYALIIYSSEYERASKAEHHDVAEEIRNYRRFRRGEYACCALATGRILGIAPFYPIPPCTDIHGQ
jgi:hypothetical protein